MKNKFLLSILIFVIAVPTFIWFEIGFEVESFKDMIKPFIFSFSLVFSLINLYRIYLLITSLTFLFLMVIFYLFWQIPLSEWFGSVGIGILTIYIFGYLPELIKNGYVKKI